MNNLKFNHFFKDPRTNWKYILIVVILAILVGGGILGYTRGFIKEIISLSKFSEINKAEKVAGEMNRILLTEKNFDEILAKECSVFEKPVFCFSCDADPPTTEVLYSSKEKGISLKIPYNPNWINNKYKIIPYFEYEDRLEFGPVEGTIGRIYTLSLKPQLSAEKLITSLMEKAVDSPLIFGVQKDSIKKEMIGNNEVVIYRMSIYEGAESELEEPNQSVILYEVIGKKYNYEFIACTNKSGWPTAWKDEETQESFCLDRPENILETIQFVD